MEEELRQETGLSRRRILERCRKITASFRRVETIPGEVQKVAGVREICIKYCHLDSWELERYPAAEQCSRSGLAASPGMRDVIFSQSVFRIKP